MSVTRRLAKSLLSAIFISSGVAALRDPSYIAGAVEAAGLSEPKKLAQIHGATNLAGGLALATNKLPRLAALGLAAGMVPTTAIGHAFWSAPPEMKQMQQINFMKNLGLIGGLLMAAVDTGGRESLGHLLGRASKRAAKKADKSGAKAGRATAKGKAGLKAGAAGPTGSRSGKASPAGATGRRGRLLSTRS